MELLAACGLDYDNHLAGSHFGDAPRYKIYKITKEKHVLIELIDNSTKEINEKKHGDERKASAVTRLLKDKGVQVLIAKRFGPNIKRVKFHFVPVKVNCCTPEEAIELVKLNFERVLEEWQKGEARSFLILR